MGGRALGALGHTQLGSDISAVDPRTASTGVPGGQGNRGPARGSGAGQGARVARQGFKLGISVLYFDHFGRLFT